MASSQPIIKLEPNDNNVYSSFQVRDDGKDQPEDRTIKDEHFDDGESLFIPEKPAPAPINAATLAYRPAPSSRPVLTSETMPKAQANFDYTPSTVNSTLPPLPSNFFAYEKITHQRLPDSDGKEAPTECFEGRLRNNGFQHRLICGHLVATDARQPCGPRCKLQTRKEVKPANKTSIECPHPNCVSVRQSMKTCLRPRKAHQRSSSKKFGVRVVPENEKGHHVKLGGLFIESTEDGFDDQQNSRPVKKIKYSSAAYQPSKIIPANAADLAAEARLKEQLATSRYDRELKKLAVDGTDTLKFKQPAGWQMDHDMELQQRRSRRQFTSDLNSGMFSMSEDHHDELVKANPSLIVDRELDDNIGDQLARSKPSNLPDLNEEDIDADRLVDSVFNYKETDEHCVCKQPKDHTMMQCDTCKNFFHANCIGKGLTAPARYKLDPDMFNAADAKHWHEQDQAFSCRDCDVKGLLAQSMLGFQKRKRTKNDTDNEHERPDLRAGKAAKLKECTTDAEKARVQRVWKLLYSSEKKLTWNDFMCAKCDQHIAGTRYHCSACFLYDLCEGCMRKGGEHPCVGNSSAYQVYYAQAKDVEMGGTNDSAVTGNQTIHGRPMRKAAQKALGGMSDLTHPQTIAAVRRQSIFK